MRIPFLAQGMLACLFLFSFSAIASAKNDHITSDTSKAISQLPAEGAIVYAPVCAADGKTYLNPETAKAAGATDLEKGHCSHYEPIKCTDPNRLWISKVEVNDMTERSGPSGYQNATNVIFDLSKYDENIIALYHAPDVKNVGVQQWKVWIDFDGDKKFSADEEVIDAVSRDIAIPLRVPAGVEIGTLTRMRVFVGWRGMGLGGDTIPLGEVEDYTVQVVE